MSRTLDAVRRVHAAARTHKVADYVLQFDNVITQAQYGVAYEIAERYVTRGTRVLDWGCGNGHFSFFLESLGAKITGYSYEPPPRAMAHSAAFEFVPGSPASASVLPFADATFDVAVGVGVLEHVWETGGDERASLAELARVTKPGGTLLTFHLPNRSGWIEPVSHLLRPAAHFHERKFDAREIRDLWNGAGFDITELARYNALPRAQMRNLPGALRHSGAFAAIYEAADRTLERLAPRVCTNFYIVARRRP